MHFRWGFCLNSWAAWLPLRLGDLLVKSTTSVPSCLTSLGLSRPHDFLVLFSSVRLLPVALWPCSAGFSGPGCLACRGRCPVQNHRGGLVGRIPAVAPQWVRLHLMPSLAAAKRLSGHTAAVMSVAYSTDGKAIVSGSRDKLVKIWDVAMGSCVKNLTGHTDFVESVAYSPDGKHIVSGGATNLSRFGMRPQAAV